MSIKECESCKHFTVDEIEEDMKEMFEDIPNPVHVIGCDLEDVEELEEDDWGKQVTQLLTDEPCTDYEVK